MLRAPSACLEIARHPLLHVIQILLQLISHAEVRSRYLDDPTVWVDVKQMCFPVDVTW